MKDQLGEKDKDKKKKQKAQLSKSKSKSKKQTSQRKKWYRSRCSKRKLKRIYKKIIGWYLDY